MNDNDIFNRPCEICGKKSTNYLYGHFVCDSLECIERAKERRGSPAGHNLNVVSVGSVNPIKVKSVEEGFKKVIGSVIVQPVNVDSGVSSHPIGMEETTKGAINRAINAYNSGQFSYGVGIEAGLIKCGDKYLDIHICAIYDGLDYTIGASRGFQLPKEIVNRILKGEECSIAVEKLYNLKDIGKKEGIIGYLTENNINRLDLCIDAVVCALIPRMKKNKHVEF